jgi:exodeoxyribonuclease-3
MSGSKRKLVSWNVNGMNAVMKKGFVEALQRLDADIVGIQETRLQESKLSEKMRSILNYRSHWAFSTAKKGYSGVAVYTRMEPVSVRCGLGIPRYDAEGRVLQLDFEDFTFFSVYFPNGQMSEERLAYKLDFYQDFFAYAGSLKDSGRSVVVAGDYNTAHNEIDLKNPKSNENTSGFLRIERDWLDRIVEQGWVDTFRYFHPEEEVYSWWTYRFKARERNVGWRIDYCFVSRDLIDSGRVSGAFIDNDILGSDHCPVGVEMKW